MRIGFAGQACARAGHGADSKRVEAHTSFLRSIIVVSFSG
jgi:hypothetical protein